MAIVQISRITNRTGLAENLPQLAGAELGWATDTRQLYIGNGTLEDGAPVVGNTEILTEFSDLFSYSTSYIYKGAAAGYTVQTGATPGSPVSQSLQSRLDSYAIVTDFGATGDGVTDDTEAINRALYEIYCRGNNTQVRRGLYFPAGTYRITESLLIPPFATLYGDGSDNSIIRMDASPDDSALRAYVARTTDSLQQMGANIGNNGATVPQHVTVENMGFETEDVDVDVFLIDCAVCCTFNQVSFSGPLTQTTLTPTGGQPYPYDIAGVRFDSTGSLTCTQIVFDKCTFQGLTYGTHTNEIVDGAVFSNSKFDTLYQGVYLDTNPTGIRVSGSTFDNIYEEGIYITASNCVSAYNMFYGVGNHFLATTSPQTPVIFINADQNVSVGDMFERTSAYATTYPRIDTNYTKSIAFTGGDKVKLGTLSIESGIRTTLVNNTSSATTIFTINSAAIKAFEIKYTITRGSPSVAVRTGTYTVVASTDGTGGTLTSNDTGFQNSSTGVTFSVTETASVISFKYTTTNTGVDAELFYSISYQS